MYRFELDPSDELQVNFIFYVDITREKLFLIIANFYFFSQ